MKKVIRYEIEDCGIDHSQYFPGRTAIFTDYDEVYVGVGDTPHTAAEDALELASELDWDVDGIENTLSKEADSTLLHYEDCPASEDESADCDCESELHYWAAVYLKGEEA